MKTLMLVLLLFPVFSFNQESGDDNLQKLKNELETLENLKFQKMDALENTEANRWNFRYEQNARTKQYEEHLRTLESTYSRLASELNNLQDDLLRSGNSTRELKAEFEEQQSFGQAFRAQIKQAVGKSADGLARDFPAGLNNHTLILSELAQKAEQKETTNGQLLQGFFKYKSSRLALTTTQSLRRQVSLIGNSEHRVKQLRLGTVFLGEASLDSAGVSQILLRTGNLQGKVFAWRNQLVGDLNEKLSHQILGAEPGVASTSILLDVTQRKSFGTGFTQDENLTAGSLVAWFKTGGIVMYPLLMLAILGLLLVMERFLVLTTRSTNGIKLMKRLEGSLKKGDWPAARKVSEGSRSTLNKVLTSILIKAQNSRTSAEKAMQEQVLKEVPELEKRMGLIAAIGGAAPLLGLLGTVSGMISLFKVITDVGTNDPRILAGGISEALVTTQTGLMIAIPILLLHGFLSDRLDRLQNDISVHSLTLLNKIWPQLKS